MAIKNKMVSHNSITVLLKEINTHYGIVEIFDTDSIVLLQQDEIPVFSDVEVRTGRNQTVIPEFLGVYAKVIEKENRKIHLRFTHSNEALKQFLVFMK